MSKHVDIQYCVRLIRKDNQPDECYLYWHKDEAEYHLKLLCNDDSGLYKRIELLTIAGNLTTVSHSIVF